MTSFFDFFPLTLLFVCLIDFLLSLGNVDRHFAQVRLVLNHELDQHGRYQTGTDIFNVFKEQHSSSNSKFSGNLSLVALPSPFLSSVKSGSIKHLDQFHDIQFSFDPE